MLNEIGRLFYASGLMFATVSAVASVLVLAFAPLAGIIGIIIYLA